MSIVIIAVLLAQVVVNGPINYAPAYLVSDPIRDTWIGVATDTGRFSARLGGDCVGFGPGQNVTVDTTDDGLVYVISHPGIDDQCHMVVGPQMSSIPCLTNDQNQCDVALESD